MCCRVGRRHVTLGFLSIDTTQWVGMAGFSVAAFLCVCVARRGHTGWWVLAALNALLVVEIVTGLRYRIHDLVNARLRAQGLYESRTLGQVILIAAALVVLLAVRFKVRTQVGSPSFHSALTGACFAVSIFLIEAISLHDVDALLYHPVGPVLAIAFLWLAASTWISWFALTAQRR